MRQLSRNCAPHTSECTDVHTCSSLIYAPTLDAAAHWINAFNSTSPPNTPQPQLPVATCERGLISAVDISAIGSAGGGCDCSGGWGL